MSKMSGGFVLAILVAFGVWSKYAEGDAVIAILSLIGFVTFVKWTFQASWALLRGE